MIWMVAFGLARADQCLCTEWEDRWAWSDCTGQDCACDCTDTVPHGDGTSSAGTDTGAPRECSESGLGEPPRADATCVLDASVCVVSDCCDDASANCPEEKGCGCTHGSPATGGFAGAVLLALGWLRRARR